MSKIFIEEFVPSISTDIKKQSCSGSDLIRTFKNLEITTGIVKKLTIDSWFNTDDPVLRDFLQWLCESLTKDNIVTLEENDEYERLLSGSRILETHEQNVALTQIELKYPGLLDVDENLFEVMLMEKEYASLNQEKEQLDNLLTLNKKLNSKLFIEVKLLEKEKGGSNLNKLNSEERCLKLSKSLEELHIKLQNQVTRYSNFLIKMEDSATPLFVYQMPLQKYANCFTEVISYIRLFLRIQSAPSATDLTIRSVKKSLLKENSTENEEVKDHLDVLKDRICDSINKYLYSLIEEQRICGEIQFLKSVNQFDVLQTSFDDSFEDILESSIEANEDLLNQFHLKIDDISKTICEVHMNIPKIKQLERDIIQNQKTFQRVAKVCSKITELTANRMLLYALLEKEYKDVSLSNKFFRNIHSYINQDLLLTKYRTEIITEITDQFNEFKEGTLEETIPLIKIKKLLLCIEDSDKSLSSVELFKKFNNDCATAEQKLVHVDFVHNNYRNFETNLRKVQKSLMRGPTNELIVIPRQLFETFDEVAQLIEKQKDLIKSSTALMTAASKQVSATKWLKVRRQLWMWFLLDPSKVESAIEKIKLSTSEE